MKSFLLCFFLLWTTQVSASENTHKLWEILDRSESIFLREIYDVRSLEKVLEEILPLIFQEFGAPDVNERSKLKGFSLLHFAVASSDIPALKRVLQRRGLNLNIKNFDGLSPLMVAANVGNLAAVEALVEAGANVDAENIIHETAISMAVIQGHQAIVEFLFPRMTNYQGAKGRNLLMLAAMRGHLALLNHLMSLRTQGVLAAVPFFPIDEIDDQGNTALHLALRSGFSNLGERLIEEGASLDILNMRNRTPVFEAARYGFWTVLIDLNRRGLALHNLLNDDGLSLMDFAALYNHPEMIFVLARQGLPLESDGQWDPISLASSVNAIDSCVLLLALGVDHRLAMVQDLDTEIMDLLKDWDEFPGDRKNILMDHILRKDNPLLAKLVVATQCRGNGCIHFAIRRENPDLLRLILRGPSQIHSRDSQGHTPLFVAVQTRNLRMIAIVLSRGANPALETIDIDRLLRPSVLEALRAGDMEGALPFLLVRSSHEPSRPEGEPAFKRRRVVSPHRSVLQRIYELSQNLETLSYLLFPEEARFAGDGFASAQPFQLCINTWGLIASFYINLHILADR